MPHHTPLIATIVGGLAIAFVLGALANRFRVSPIVGYLLAGIVIGPSTPGFVADQALANELAEIGVILLMFGVGLHFSVTDLLSVRAIAIPGALVQIAFATLLGLGLALLLGWPVGAGVVFGLALSVASTVVLLRALRERRLLDTERGRIAVGWLIVEDIAMVLALVLLPVLAPLFKEGAAASGGPTLLELATTVGITLGKIGAFFAIMLVVGRRLIPWILHYIVYTGSRELFRLAVLTIALGVAYGAAQLFGVSFALGAFFAGMILSESPLSQQAANESLPLRDAFAVLFFISVGMLFRPAIVLSSPWALIATLSIIIVGKSLAALLIAWALRHPLSTALMISASLAQIGEFSFILAALGIDLGLLPEEGRDLILAGAIFSILVNPLLFDLLHRARPWLDQRERRSAPPAVDAEAPAVEEPEATSLQDHAVVIGFGRVGSLVGKALRASAVPLLVIEEKDELTRQLRADGFEVLASSALASDTLKAANVAGAKWLFVAIPDGFEGGQIVEQARSANAALKIIARAHSDAEVEHLYKHGADEVVMGEREIAEAMAGFAGVAASSRRDGGR
jgi:CPA2 family monovalent cation:H+ antiporter-2